MAEDISKITVYKGQTLGELFREIHANVIVKQGKIEELIMTLMPMIKNSQDAVMLVPMIKEYLDVGVKNDELLVKMAAIVQRYASSTTKGSGDEVGILSEEEKKRLLEEAQNFIDEATDSLNNSKDK